MSDPTPTRPRKPGPRKTSHLDPVTALGALYQDSPPPVRDVIRRVVKAGSAVNANDLAVAVTASGRLTDATTPLALALFDAIDAPNDANGTH